MKVKITQAMIDQGVPSMPCNCPLALGITAALFVEADKPKWFVVSVGSRLACVQSSVGYKEAFLPDEARRFRARFDARQTVQPFEFDIQF